MNQNSELDASIIKKTSHVFFIYLSTLIYVLVTAISITQVQLILNEYVSLPIIGVGVKITLFLFVSPLVLITLFIIYNIQYLHLKNLKDSEISSQFYWPIFEFGKFNLSTDKKWILNFLQLSTSNFIIWGLLPLTLFVICFIYLPSHSYDLILWLIACAFLGNFLVYYFWIENNNYRKKLVNYSILICSVLLFIFYFTVTPQYNSFVENFIYQGSGKDAKLFAIAIIIMLLISIITVFVIRFCNTLWQFTTTGKFFEHMFYNIWIIILLSPLICIHYLINTESGKNRNINLSYQIISQNPNQVHKGIYSVDLRSKNLINAKLISSVLIKADMRSANLRMAALYSARLDSANLEGANFQHAILPEAIFNYAILDSANLSYTNLIGVYFGNTKLRMANLKHSDLRKSKLKSAILDGADLSYADLRGAEINYTQLGKVKSLYSANLDSTVLEDIRNHYAYLLEKR